MRKELSDLSDEQLMAMVRNKDHGALGELYTRHGKMVRIALKRTIPSINDEDVAELVHDVFIAVNDSAAKYKEQMRFKAWLYSIATRKVRHWNRKRWVRQKLLGKEYGHKQDLDTAVGASASDSPFTKHVIERAMSTLSPKLRDVFWLHTVEGFTAPEIGRMLGVSEAVVWTRVHRARKKLYELLKGEGDA